MDKAFARTISQLVEVAEAMFGTEQANRQKWEFYRSVVLKRLNELKRDIQDTNQEREGSRNGYCKSEKQV